MEKGQVTFAVRAFGATLPVGQPILLVTHRPTGAANEWVLYLERTGSLEEDDRVEALPGPLPSFDAQLLSELVSDALYRWLVGNVGIQGQLESLP